MNEALMMLHDVPEEIFRQVMIDDNFSALAEYFDHITSAHNHELFDGAQFEIADIPFMDGTATLILTYYVQFPGGPEEQKPCLDTYLTGEDYVGYDYVKRYTDWRRDDWKDQMARHMLEECERYVREA